VPPLPPTQYVLEALQDNVFPAAGGSALVLCLFLLLGRWAGALGSAVAVAVGFLSANFTLEYLKFDERPTWENTARLIPLVPGENAPGWHWLPRVALVLVLVGLLSRWVGLVAARYLPERYWWTANVLVWVPRVIAVGMATGWLVSGTAAAAPEWESLRFQLAASILLIWIALDGVARTEAGAEIAGYMAVILLATGAILLYTHNAKFMEIAIIVGFAMFGIAVAAMLVKADTSGAMPVAAAFLPGLILGTRPSWEPHNVPVLSLWLVALAPLVFIPFLLPVVQRQNRWLLMALRVTLVLAPVIAAVVLAAQHEQLAFEEEW
jgi:hypothetical protein